MIQALIFDFDGLILDTEGPEFTSWQEVFAAHGLTLPLSTYAVAIGTADAFDPLAELERQLGRSVDRERIRAARRARNQELIAAQALRPGIEAYLARADQLGLRLGVASSSTRDWVAGHLERLGIIGHFACLRCRDDVARVKPDPELYRSALAALGARPDQAVALEDSPNGILAAKRADLFCVAIPNPLTRRLRLDQADLRVDSLADLPLEQLLAKAQV